MQHIVGVVSVALQSAMRCYDMSEGSQDVLVRCGN
jgi:hypothetical protein